jgi:hypothetical protein
MPTIADMLRAYDWMNMPKIPRQGGAPGMKGLGFFGALPSVDPNGRPSYSTELSGNQDNLHFPLMVPTLSKEELDHLLSGKQATDEIWKKARAHAMSRGMGAKDTFATMYDPVSRIP